MWSKMCVRELWSPVKWCQIITVAESYKNKLSPNPDPPEEVTWLSNETHWAENQRKRRRKSTIRNKRPMDPI